jgi:hypothetical protein
LLGGKIVRRIEGRLKGWIGKIVRVVLRSNKYIKSWNCRASRRNNVRLDSDRRCSAGRCGCTTLRDVYYPLYQDGAISAWNVSVNIGAVGCVPNLGLEVLLRLSHVDNSLYKNMNLSEKRFC